MRRWYRMTCGDEEVFTGYTDPAKRWNGAVLPWFTREEMEHITHWCGATFGQTVVYDAATDRYTLYECGEACEVCEGEDVDGMHLYAMGAGLWVWSLKEEES